MRHFRFLCLLAITCLGLGFYCCELNDQLYQHQAPFFDSLSYYEHLFRVMTIAQEQGIFAALYEACFSETTVCLPFLVAAVLGTVMSPDRCVGVGIQTGLLFLFLASLYHYLTAILKLKPATATLGVFSFLGSACLFYDNGGLSDFRMDLGLSLTFGITVCWFFSALARPTWRSFTLLGLAAGVCCLSRATAPVYLVVTLFPVGVSEIILKMAFPSDRDRRDLKTILGGLFWAVILTTLTAGWFYVANIEYLQYYYLIWNTDANAKIPWAETTGHLTMAGNCVGDSLWAMFAAWGAGLAWWMIRSTKTCSPHSERRHLIPGLDLRILWIAIAPLAIMMVRRAGLNPFVCMPSAVGLILFVTLPMLQKLESTSSKSLVRYFWICLVIAVAISAARGWRRHQQRSSFDTMTAQKQIMDLIIADSRQAQGSPPRRRTRCRFGVMQISDLNTRSLYSTLLFDRPRSQVDRHLHWVEIEGRSYMRWLVFSLPAAADWTDVPGNGDSEKIDELIRIANQEIDYLVVPAAATAEYLTRQFSHNHINRHLIPLRNRVLGGSWEKISPTIQVQEQEFVNVYRNLKTARQ